MRFRERKALILFARSVFALFALALICYALLLAVNWRDAERSAQAREFHDILHPASPVSDTKNAFIYLIGITVQSPATPGEAGLELAEVVRTQWGASERVLTGTFENPAAFVKRRWRDAEFDWRQSSDLAGLGEACGFLEPAASGAGQGGRCGQAIDSSPALAATIGEYSWLLPRYERLLGFKEWQHVHAESPPMADFYSSIEGAVRTAQTLYLAEAIQKMHSGRLSEFKRRFQRDAQFWRLALENAGNLLWRRFAEERLKRNLLMLNYGVQAFDGESVADAFPSVWRRPIGLEERSLKRALAGELLLARFSLMQYVEHHAKWWEKVAIYPFFQLQASQNALARLYLQWVEVTENSWFEIGEWLSNDRSVVSDNLFERQSGGVFYNPSGRYYLSRSSRIDSFTPYVASTAEVEVARVAALTAHEARRSGVGENEMEAFLRERAPANPLTEAPQGWSEKESALPVEVPGDVQAAGSSPGLVFVIEF